MADSCQHLRITGDNPYESSAFAKRTDHDEASEDEAMTAEKTRLPSSCSPTRSIHFSRRKVLRKNRLAKRMLFLYTKAERKASKYPSPHGYGDGLFERTCRRCDRAMRHQEAAEKAYAAWKSVASQ